MAARDFIDWDALGANLIRVRKLRRWTQKELADKLNVHSSLVTRWEKGHIRPKEGQVEQIAQALAVNVDELFAHPGPARSVAEDSEEPELQELLRQVETLDKSDKQALKAVLQGLLLKSKLRDVVGAGRLLHSAAS